MSAPPRPLDGDRAEMKPNFYVYTAEIEGKGKKYSCWNATDDTQFKLTFAFTDHTMEKLSNDVVNKDANTFMISVYPGEAKEFLQGSFKGSMKKGLAFGTPDKAWQEKQAASTTAHLDVEIAAVRAALKANPSKDGRYTADYISSVCVKEGIPFVDLTYPPKESSLFRDFEESQSSLRGKVFPWKRPAEYCPKGVHPALYVGKIEPSDLDQGALGNCYLLSALACVAEFPEVIRNLMEVPREPELGVYRVRMCKNGWWQVVTVDDLVPMEGQRPVFAKNREEPNEIWPSIVEKVYAKLHGSYQAICKGDATHAVTDFLGTPYWKFKDMPEWGDGKTRDALFPKILKWDQENAVMTLGTPGVDPKHSGKNASAENVALGKKYQEAGLVAGHAFCLVGAKEHAGNRLCLIKNPWGSEHEWSGKWSDDDKSWTPEMKKACGHQEALDTPGLFFMGYEDIWQWFETGSVSYLKCVTEWSSVRIAANFDKGIPDCVLKVTVTGKKPAHIITGLHQKDNRGLRPGDPDNKYLGYKISVLEQGADGKCKVHSTTADSYMIARDIFCETVLEPKPASEPYFLLPQCYSEDDKSFVHSVFLEDTDGVTIETVGYKEGAGKKINNGALFAPSTCSQKVAAQMQIMTPAMKLDWAEAEASVVDFAGAMKLLAAKPKPAGRLDTKVDEARVAAAMKKAEALAAKAGAAPAASGGLSFKVTVISGSGLKAMDANGLSDPYVVVAVVDKAGKTRGDIEAQSTKTVNKTLEPTWGDQFTIDGIAADNQFFVQCFDADMTGEDDSMGEALVPIPSLGLKKGQSKMVDVKLTKGQGVIKVMFAM